MRNSNSVPYIKENVHYLLYFFGGVILVFTLIYFLLGWYVFNFTTKKLDYITALNLFDDCKYLRGLTSQRAWIFFTKLVLYGFIKGYPVSIFIDYPIDKYTRRSVGIDFFIIRFNNKVVDKILIPLDGEGDLKEDLKFKIDEHIALLADKGLEPQEEYQQK